MNDKKARTTIYGHLFISYLIVRQGVPAEATSHVLWIFIKFKISIFVIFLALGTTDDNGGLGGGHHTRWPSSCCRRCGCSSSGRGSCRGGSGRGSGGSSSGSSRCGGGCGGCSSRGCSCGGCCRSSSCCGDSVTAIIVRECTWRIDGSVESSVLFNPFIVLTHSSVNSRSFVLKCEI